MLISRRAVDDFLARRLDDHAWMKALRRDEILAELKTMRVRPRFRTESWTHQLVCFLIAMSRPEFLFLLDMGLGKTKIAADIMTQRLREKRMTRALVGVPRVINIDSWTDDLEIHSHLGYNPVNCSDIEEKRERLLHPGRDHDVTIIDYAGLTLALSRKKKVSEKGKTVTRLVRDDRMTERVQALYNFGLLDESHKLSSHDNTWYWNMRAVTRYMEFCYATTGTLFGRNVEDLWSQFFLVDRGETFGETLGLFKAALFLPDPVKPWQRMPTFSFNKSMQGELHRMLQHRSLRYDEDEIPELEVPRRVPKVDRCDMSEEQREHYMRALEGLINANGRLEDMDAQWLRMRQIISGYLAWKDETGDHVIRFAKNPKMDLLERRIDEMGDSKIVVCYDYTETGRMIVDRVKAMGLGYEWFYGGTKDKTASRKRFMTDPDCRVFVMNSEAGGTGNDGLQKVSRYMVFYETPPPPITRKQTVKRISRPGQKERTFIYDLVMRRSLDGGILASLAEGIDLYDNVVNGRGKPSREFFLR